MVRKYNCLSTNTVPCSLCPIPYSPGEDTFITQLLSVTEWVTQTTADLGVRVGWTEQCERSSVVVSLSLRCVVIHVNMQRQSSMFTLEFTVDPQTAGRVTEGILKATEVATVETMQCGKRGVAWSPECWSSGFLGRDL